MPLSHTCVRHHHFTSNRSDSSAAAKSSCLPLTSALGAVDSFEDVTTRPADLGQDFVGLCLKHICAWARSTEQSHKQLLQVKSQKKLTQSGHQARLSITWLQLKHEIACRTKAFSQHISGVDTGSTLDQHY